MKITVPFDYACPEHAGDFYPEEVGGSITVTKVEQQRPAMPTPRHPSGLSPALPPCA